MDLEPRRESVFEIWASAAQRAATFDPTDSPLYEQVGFVVGAPRSGTTWLQQMLLVHPLITTGGESHLFCEGLPEVFTNFANPDATSHLSSWVAREELLGAARAFCDAVFAAQRRGTRPDARIVLEKTPNHRLQSELQATLYPDARYVHIVRDGRDAAASQQKLWGAAASEYASPRRVAEGWAASVRDVRAHMSGLAYIELRYEDVVAEPAKALATIFDHFRLPYDDDLCQAAATFGKAPVNTPRKAGELSGGRNDSTAERSVARAAGDLLVEFGYADEAEVQRLASERSVATLVADARDVVTHAPSRTRAWIDDTRERLARRKKRQTMYPMYRLGDRLTEAINTHNPAAFTTECAPEAAAAATATFERLGPTRVIGRRHGPDQVELTVINDAGDRTVLQLAVRKGAVTAIDASR